MDLITKKEAAKRARVAVKTISRWQTEGKLTTYARRLPSGQVSNVVDKDELTKLLVDPLPAVTDLGPGAFDHLPAEHPAPIATHDGAET